MLVKVYAPLAFAALSFAAAISNPSMVERSEMAARQFPGDPFDSTSTKTGSSIDGGKKVDEGIGPVVTDEGDDGSPKDNANDNGNDNANGNIYPGGWFARRQFPGVPTDPFTGSTDSKTGSSIDGGKKVDGGIGPVITDGGDDGSPRGNANGNGNGNGNGNQFYPPPPPPPQEECGECQQKQ
ncbi:hypothetical protein Plec18167_006308 [Paecilomyces lecythidis]|uniref:Uncharacterized protein n=1 Tax=Paecilomyces lecythidis TaxID=3004212 RepID=A0ABR3XCV1_9EURO